MDEARIVSFSDRRQHESIKKKEQYSHAEWVEVILQWVIRGNVKHTSWVVLALFPGLPCFILRFAFREAEECEKHVLYWTQTKEQKRGRSGNEARVVLEILSTTILQALSTRTLFPGRLLPTSSLALKAWQQTPVLTGCWHPVLCRCSHTWICGL